MSSFQYRLDCTTYGLFQFYPQINPQVDFEYKAQKPDGTLEGRVHFKRELKLNKG